MKSLVETQSTSYEISKSDSRHVTFSRRRLTYEPVHEISNNVVIATSKASDQPAHTRSLTRAFTSR